MLIEVPVPDADADALRTLARRCGTDVAGLLAILAADAALVVRRPGSWEAEAAAALLAGHGFEEAAS